MATDEGETIIITAKKMTEDGGANSSVWQNTAFIRNKSTGYISGVQNNAALRKAFNELTSKDTIITL